MSAGMGVKWRNVFNRISYTKACLKINRAFLHSSSYPSGISIFLSARKSLNAASVFLHLLSSAYIFLMPRPRMLSKKSHPDSTHKLRNNSKSQPLKSNGGGPFLRCTSSKFSSFSSRAGGGPANMFRHLNSFASPLFSSLKITVSHPYATKSLSSVNTKSTPPSLEGVAANAAICPSASYGATINSKPCLLNATMSSCAIAGVTSIPAANAFFAP